MVKNKQILLICWYKLSYTKEYEYKPIRDEIHMFIMRQLINKIYRLVDHASMCVGHSVGACYLILSDTLQYTAVNEQPVRVRAHTAQPPISWGLGGLFIFNNS